MIEIDSHGTVTVVDKKEQSAASIASPGRTKQLLARHQFTLKKSLGQNFLTDANTLDRIVAAAQLDAHSGVIEIGPGAGSLTQKLAFVAKRVVAVEIDARLLPILAETLAPFPNVDVVQADILKIDLDALLHTHFSVCDSVSVVANLPYYITTPIVLALLEQRLRLRQMVVMMQKEVADRIMARPGTKDYGSLSIAVQYYCTAEEALRVPRTVFMPPPNVDSSVLRLTVRAQPAVTVQSENTFFAIVRAAFAQRRKTISNNLLRHFSGRLTREQIDGILRECAIDPSLRAEALAMADFARLADKLTT